MRTDKKSLLAILFLITTTSVALAYMGGRNPSASTLIPPGQGSDNPIVTVGTALAQDKVLKGSDGKISLAVTLNAANIESPGMEEQQPVDLVVVLDRSGSMRGQKIRDARMAVISLLERLGGQDRMSIITYSDGIEILSPLVHLNDSRRERLSTIVQRIQAGGGTYLSGGLESSIATLKQIPTDGRQRKIILISDGLANHGITHPTALGAMAAQATEYNLAISSIGVGYDFNEIVMTSIADHGSGNYYFLENPRAIAQVFKTEFEKTRKVVAGGVEIRIPLKDGVQLLDAGGYPITREGNVAVIHPGDLMAGQQRKIFLSYRLPTSQERSFSLGKPQVRYLHRGEFQTVFAPGELSIGCVMDQKEVIASIDEIVWSEQVVKEDFNKLKEDVAVAIRSGKKGEALDAIEEYEVKNNAINSRVDSDSVTRNLEKDVKGLRQSVQSTFAGAPAAVEAKKKQQAKSLQYESYRIRRDKN
jgi:Ca-activated chloride channel family protein